MICKLTRSALLCVALLFVSRETTAQPPGATLDARTPVAGTSSERWMPKVRVSPATPNESLLRAPAVVWTRTPQTTEARLLCAWSDGGIALATSSDGGVTWQPSPPPARVGERTSETLRKPALAASRDGAVVMVAVVNEERIVATRSGDGGATWGVWQDVAPSATYATQVTPKVAYLSDGRFVAVWSEIPAGADVVLGPSVIAMAELPAGAGAAWKRLHDISLTRTTASSATIIAHRYPDIAAMDNRWAVVWEASEPTTSALRRSEIFARMEGAEPVRVSAADALPRNHRPRIVFDGGIRAFVAWHSYNASRDVTTTEPMSAEADILTRVWTSQTGFADAPLVVNANSPSEFGADLNAALGAAANRSVWIAWQSTDSLGGAKGTDDDILAARIPGPRELSSRPVGEQVIVNSDATTDSRFDAFDTNVAVASWPVGWSDVRPPLQCPSGVVAVWVSEDTAGLPDTRNSVASSRLAR